VEPYSFTDADGGPDGAESEVEEDEEEHGDTLDEEGKEGDEAEEDEEAEGGMEESDEEDDTTDNLWECGDAPPAPPAGFTYAPCPPLETEEQQRALIGRQVLVAHNSEPVGWHIGKVRFFGVAAKWKKHSARRPTSWCATPRRIRVAWCRVRRAVSFRRATMVPMSGGCCLHQHWCPLSRPRPLHPPRPPRPTRPPRPPRPPRPLHPLRPPGHSRR
jgi:hypothetical protein